jgi:hypothetical protein
LDIPPVDGEFVWTNPKTRAAYSVYEQRIAALARESGFRLRELAIARGSFLIWSANLLHGGSPRDDRTLTRKSQVTHYYFTDAVPFTPMFSRRSEGRYAVRHVRDVRTGRWVIPSLDGTPVVFPNGGGGLRRIRPMGGFDAALARVTPRHAGLAEPPADFVGRVARGIARRLRR